ncbi:MAG TPA: DUF1428 domain-containing protein [Polyangiales bacterium]|nr:DUF1428 domain-containing protein [Polyangiales bacterium]
MAKYVDGFVVPVPKNRLEEYRKFAEDAGKVWREYGALAYVEAAGDDVPMGEVTSFPRAVHATPDEIVVFAWIVYESREQRDQVNAKVMKDPRFANQDPKSFPFDAKRMFWAGFKTIVDI